MDDSVLTVPLEIEGPLPCQVVSSSPLKPTWGTRASGDEPHGSFQTNLRGRRASAQAGRPAPCPGKSLCWLVRALAQAAGYGSRSCPGNGDPRQPRPTRHLIRIPCDDALTTWALTVALTWALTLKLPLNGPAKSPIRRLS